MEHQYKVEAAVLTTIYIEGRGGERQSGGGEDRGSESPGSVCCGVYYTHTQEEE